MLWSLARQEKYAAERERYLKEIKVYKSQIRKDAGKGPILKHVVPKERSQKSVVVKDKERSPKDVVVQDKELNINFNLNGDFD